MANFKIVDQALFPGVPAVVTATQTYATNNIPVPLGAQLEGRDFAASGNLGGAVFQFCRGSDVTAGSQWVQLQGNSAVRLAAANSASYFPIGIAMGALSASNVYGWVMVAGQLAAVPLLASGTSCPAGANLYINADTDSGQGFVQFAAAAGNQVHGACPIAAVASDATAIGTVQINYPGVWGVSASI